MENNEFKTFWVVTCKYVLQKSSVKYVRWYMKSRNCFFPYRYFLQVFQKKYRVTPTIISTIEISREDYEYMVGKFNNVENE